MVERQKLISSITAGIIIIGLMLIPGCRWFEQAPDNTAPVISDLTASKTACDYGESVTITATVIDADGDPISYTWSATRGTHNDTGATSVWTAPNEAGVQTITLTVSDGVNDSVTKTVQITVGTQAFQVSSFFAQPDDSEVTLVWNNPVYSNFGGVEIRRNEGAFPENRADGELVYQGTSTTHKDLGLSNGVKYYYKAWVYNQQVNYEDIGATASAIPAAINDSEDNEDIFNDGTNITIESFVLNRTPYKGERILMQLELKNNSDTTYNNVTATVSTTSSYATLLEPTDNGYNSIAPGESDLGSGNPPLIKFDITTNAPPMEPIVFDVEINATNGGPFTGTVTVYVKPTEAYVRYLTHTVTQEVNGNGNMTINPNETIRFNTTLINSGTAEAGGVEANLVCTSGNATVNDSSEDYGLMARGVSSTGTGNGYEVNFPSSLNDGDAVDFNLEISDEDGNNWTSPFTITIRDDAGPVEIVSASYGDEISGDGDDMIEPGETIGIYVTVKNNGPSTVRNITGTLSTTTPNITISDPDDSYGDIASNGTDSGTSAIPWGYRFEVGSGVASGTVIDFNLHLTDTDGHEWDDTFTMTVQ